MTIDRHGKQTVKARAVGELKEFTVLFAYLYTAFAALLLFKIGVLRELADHWTPLGLAAIKALLVAKFVLVGRAAHVGERFAGRPLIWQTVYRSLVFLFVVLVLTIIEEAIVGLIHHRPLWESVSAIGGGNSTEFVATLVLLFLIFFPYFGYRALGEVLGERMLLSLFFVRGRNLKIEE